MTSLGESGRGGIGDIKSAFQSGSKPPLARLADRVCIAQAALRSEGTGKDAASETLASIAKCNLRPSAPVSMRAGGRPSRVLCDPNRRPSPTHRDPFVGTWLTCKRSRIWRDGDRGALGGRAVCATILDPAEAERRASDVSRMATSSALGIAGMCAL